jgi:hypothetical protein
MTAIRARKTSTKIDRPVWIGASANLVKQIPLIKRHFPEFAAAVRGTINLELEQAIIVITCDCQTPPIDWEDVGGDPEVFDLVPAQLEVGRTKYDGWLYVAHGSPHRSDPKKHEFVGRDEIKILDGEGCRLHILRPCRVMPYSKWPAVLID